MPGLTWTAPALRDLRDIEAFLDTEASPAVASRMLKDIRAKAELLRSFPHAGPPVPDKDFRSLRISRTPFLLTYRLRASGAEILRIYHDRQNWRADT